MSLQADWDLLRGRTRQPFEAEGTPWKCAKCDKVFPYEDHFSTEDGDMRCPECDSEDIFPRDDGGWPDELSRTLNNLVYRGYVAQVGLGIGSLEKARIYMARRIYVGNLSWNTSEETLKEVFSDFGTVSSCKVLIDRETNQSRGFGFVEMSTDAEAAHAISGMNGQNLDGRNLTVNEAKEREDRGGGGGARQGGGGYQGGQGRARS